MRLTQIDTASISFEPPLWQKSRRGCREVILLREDGALFTGISVHFPKGSSSQIEIPEELHSTNRPEWGTRTVRLTALQHDTLRERIRKQLTLRQSAPLDSDWQRTADAGRRP